MGGKHWCAVAVIDANHLPRSIERLFRLAERCRGAASPIHGASRAAVIAPSFMTGSGAKAGFIVAPFTGLLDVLALAALRGKPRIDWRIGERAPDGSSRCSEKPREQG